MDMNELIETEPDIKKEPTVLYMAVLALAIMATIFIWDNAINTILTVLENS